MDAIILVSVLICSVVVHEVSHAWQAHREGDDTAATWFAISQEPVPGHSKEMCAAACTDMAHASAIDVAKTLALTACELLAAPDLLESARAEFAERGK